MNEDIKQIGQRLKGLREALDMTTEEFASSCGIDPVVYLEYEEGKKI